MDRLPVSYSTVDFNTNGNCLFDSFAFQLEETDHKFLRQLANDFVDVYFNQFKVSENGVAINLIDLLVSPGDIIALESLFEYAQKGYITIENKAIKFTKTGYLHHFNRTNVFGQSLHLISLSIIFHSSIEIYAINIDGSFNVQLINKHLNGPIIRLALDNQHYKPLIELNSAKDQIPQITSSKADRNVKFKNLSDKDKVIL